MRYLILTNNSSQSVTTDFIIETYTKKELLYNDLKQADDTVKLSVPYSSNVLSFLNANIDTNINAQITNNDTVEFTGFVRPQFDFTKIQKNQPINLELVNLSYILDSYETEEDIAFKDTTLAHIIASVVEDVGLTVDETKCPTDTVDFCKIDEGTSIRDILSNLLFEYGYSWDFDKNGDFTYQSLFSAPSNKTVLNGQNIRESIKINKTEQNYNKVKLTYTEVDKKSNEIVFCDTTDGKVEKGCVITIDAGNYLGTTDSENDTPVSDYGTRSWTTSQWASHTVVGYTNTTSNGYVQNSIDDLEKGELICIPVKITDQNNKEGFIYAKILDWAYDSSKGYYRLATIYQDSHFGKPYDITYDSEDGEVIWADNATINIESSNNSGLVIDFTNNNTYGTLSVKNNSAYPITITKLQVVAETAYVKATDSSEIDTTIEGNFIKRKDLTAKYLTDKVHAIALAEGYAKWTQWADYTVTLKSKLDLDVGSYVDVVDDSIGTITGRIIQKDSKLDGSPIQYKIESVSEYVNPTVTSRNIRKSASLDLTGATGERGTGILKVTTSPTTSAQTIGGISTNYYIALSTLKSQANVDVVLVGDVIQYSYYTYQIVVMDSTNAYASVRTSIRGATGATGSQGPQGEQGPKGNDGTSVTILGTKDSTSELPTSGNTVGDGYLIDGYLYTWTADNEWVNVGKIKGDDGTNILKVTTAPTSYTTTVDTFTPKYRIALSTVLSQSGVSTVKVGDVILYSYYTYNVGYIDTSYVYLGSATSIRGAQGATGATGETGPQGEQGIQGETGPSGYSPTVSVSKSGTITTITITDESGEHTSTINDGSNGSSLVNKGNYSSSTAYSVNQYVYYSTTKTSYVCKKATTAGILPTNTTYWSVLAAQGETGPQGIQGIQGETGKDAVQYYNHYVFTDNITTGENYSTTESRKYLGTYIDTTLADASTWEDLQEIDKTKSVVWTRIESEPVRNNLLRGTNDSIFGSSQSYSSRGWRGSTENTTTKTVLTNQILPDSNISTVWHFENIYNSTHTDISQDNVPMVVGQTYTLSCWAKADSTSARMYFQWGYQSPFLSKADGYLTTEWARYSYTFTLAEAQLDSTDNATNIYFGVYGNQGGTFDIAGMKLEAGDSATDWCEHQSDMVGTQVFYSDYTRNWTNAQWAKYTVKGDSTYEWDNSYITDIRVGDTLILTPTLTEQNNITGAVYIRVTAIPSAKSSNGYYKIPGTVLYSIVGYQGQQGIQGEQGETGTRGTLEFSGTEIGNIRSEYAYALTTSSVGITSTSMPILVGDTYVNSLTNDVWKCTVAGTASTAKWTWQERRISDTEDNNIMRFFSPETTYESLNSMPSSLVSETVTGENPFGELDTLRRYYLPENSSQPSGQRINPYSRVFRVDTSKTYRYVCYIKEMDSTHRDYFGLRGYYNSDGNDPYITYLSGTGLKSAYFWGGSNLGTLGKWYMVVGYVVASDLTAAPSDSGIYDVKTGKKIKDISNNFRWQDLGITEFTHTGTLIGYTDTNGNNTSFEKFIYDMRFDVIDGNEPTIEELLHTDTGNTIKYFKDLDRTTYQCNTGNAIGYTANYENVNNVLVNKGDILQINVTNSETGRKYTVYAKANQSSNETVLDTNKVNASVVSVTYGEAPVMENLCPNADFASGFYNWAIQGYSSCTIGEDSTVGTYIEYTKSANDSVYSNNNRIYNGGSSASIPLTTYLPAGTYKVSFWAKCQTEGQKITTFISSSAQVETELTTEWVKYTLSLYTTSASVAFTPLRPYLADNTVYMAGIKIEKGDAATQWNAFNGEGRGSGAYRINTAPTVYSSTVFGKTCAYRISTTTVLSEIGESRPVLGDVLIYGSNSYTVVLASSAYIYLSSETSLKGEKGDDGGYQDYVFAIGAFDLTETELLALDWQDAPPTVTTEKPCLYMATKWID